MTDRELEARLRALYASRGPAEPGAPIELRSELIAITRGPSPTVRFGSRTWVVLAAAALLGAMLIGGALVAGSGLLRSIALVPPTEPPSSAPAPSDEPPLRGGWPKTVAGPAGRYTWDPYGDHGWAHKVPDGSLKSGSVELGFRLTTQPDELEAMADALASYGDGPFPDHPVEIPGLAVQTWVVEDGAIVEQGAPGERPPPTSGTIKTPQTYLMGIGDRVVTVVEGAPGERPPPSSVIAKATQTWLMDMADRVVAIDITTYSDTPPALLAEAEAAIRSVHVGRTPYGDLRLVFELTQGWDSG